MASQKALDAKHEKILRELSRRPDNKRCANCETTGPSYVVTNFNTFVCTVCGGIHRQFGHRVKGITMASFKPEEIKALQEGGNERCLKSLLAKWTPNDLPKPADRSSQKVKDWIEAVYVKKRYYSSEVVVAAKEEAPKSLNVPKLQVPIPAEAGGPAPGSGLAGPPQASFDPFAVATSSSASATTDVSWADFGSSKPVEAVPSPSTDFFGGQDMRPVQKDSWQAFPAESVTAAAMPVPVASQAANVPSQPINQSAGWMTFGEESSVVQVESTVPASSQGWEAFSTEQASHPAVKVQPDVHSAPQPQPTHAPPIANPAKELPLELFSDVVSLGLTPQGGVPFGVGQPGSGQQASFGMPNSIQNNGFGQMAMGGMQGYANVQQPNFSGMPIFEPHMAHQQTGFSGASTFDQFGYSGASFLPQQGVHGASVPHPQMSVGNGLGLSVDSPQFVNGAGGFGGAPQSGFGGAQPFAGAFNSVAGAGGYGSGEIGMVGPGGGATFAATPGIQGSSGVATAETFPGKRQGGEPFMDAFADLAPSLSATLPVPTRPSPSEYHSGGASFNQVNFPAPTEHFSGGAGLNQVNLPAPTDHFSSGASLPQVNFPAAQVGGSSGNPFA